MANFFNNENSKKNRDEWSKLIGKELDKITDKEIMNMLMGSFATTMTTGGSSNMGYRDPMSTSYHVSSHSQREKVLLIGGDNHGDHAEVPKGMTHYQTYSRKPQAPTFSAEPEMEIVLNDDGTVSEREVPFMDQTVDLIMYVRCRFRTNGRDEYFFKHEKMSDKEAYDLYASGFEPKTATTPQSGFYLCGIPITCRGIYDSFLEIVDHYQVQKAMDLMSNGHPRNCHAEIHGRRVEIVECDIQQGGAETVLRIKFSHVGRY